MAHLNSVRPLVLALSVLVCFGCASPITAGWRTVEGSETAKRFESIISVAQTEHLGCAAVALTYIFQYYGIETNTVHLNKEFQNPFAVHFEEIADVLRKYNLFSILIENDFMRLKKIVNSGTPAIVLWGISIFGKDKFHYSVLCGVENGYALLLDGVNGKHSIEEPIFEKMWRSAGALARLGLPPDKITFELSPDDKVSLGIFWEEHHEFAKAEGLYLEAYDGFKEKRKRSIALSNAGRARFLTGKKNEALDLFERAIVEDPTYAPAFNNLAYALLETDGDLNRALNLVKESLRLDPENEKIYNRTLNQIKNSIEKKSLPPEPTNRCP